VADEKEAKEKGWKLSEHVKTCWVCPTCQTCTDKDPCYLCFVCWPGTCAGSNPVFGIAEGNMKETFYTIRLNHRSGKQTYVRSDNYAQSLTCSNPINQFPSLEVAHAKLDKFAMQRKGWAIADPVVSIDILKMAPTIEYHTEYTDPGITVAGG